MIYILNILIYNMKLLILICLNMITVIISNQLNLNYLHKDILRSYLNLNNNYNYSIDTLSTNYKPINIKKKLIRTDNINYLYYLR